MNGPLKNTGSPGEQIIKGETSIQQTLFKGPGKQCSTYTTLRRPNDSKKGDEPKVCTRFCDQVGGVLY